MQKNKTYFEQVPLQTIRWILEEDSRRRSEIEKPKGPKIDAVEEEILLAAANYRAGGKS